MCENDKNDVQTMSNNVLEHVVAQMNQIQGAKVVKCTKVWWNAVGTHCGGIIRVHTPKGGKVAPFKAIMVQYGMKPYLVYNDKLKDGQSIKMYWSLVEKDKFCVKED